MTPRAATGWSADDLRGFYEERTGEPWTDEAGIRWLTCRYEELEICRRTPRLDKTAHVYLSDKASWLSQQYCSICRSDFPIKNIPLRIEPESWQSLDSTTKKAFKAAISARFATGPLASEPIAGRICLSFVFVCSASRRIRDLDNMAKILMDALKGVIMGDDRHVDHLRLARLTHDGEEEYVHVRIANSNLNDHSDVAGNILMHEWGEMPKL